MNLLIIIVILGLAYFFLMLPARRKRTAHATMQDSVDVGDEIISAGGLHGRITGVHDEEGTVLVEIAPNVVVKCPLTLAGLEATRILNDEGIKVNVTLCFSAAQAVCAAKAGASFISPFLGRLDDIGDNGLRLLEEIIEIYENYSWKTEVLAASLRHPIHVIEAARMGSDIATMPFKVLQQLLKHPLTDKGQEQFLADWKKTAAAKA